MTSAVPDPDELPPPHGAASDRLALLRELERKVLWLSTWTIHNANHLRPNIDGLKVGGHQASSASVATLMTALYLDVLRPRDRVAVKPHASPVFHAIQYLLGRQTREQLERFRSLGGAQSYPSRTKDSDEVDISTGSVGLGVAMTSFAALVQDYLEGHHWLGDPPRRGRMVAVVGDAELDEGNVYEALLEGWKHDVRNVWWVVDYNRQSLDAVISDRLFTRFNRLFTSMGWNVVTLKYGKRLQQAIARPGGEALRQWIDSCPNSLYSALVVKGGAAWRERLLADIGTREGVRALLGDYDDDALRHLMTNLGGHDMASLLEAFASVTDDRPTCFFAYTIKGYGLPLAGHKDNHSGLMSVEDMAVMRETHGVATGEEWHRFSGLRFPEADLARFLAAVPFNGAVSRRPAAARIAVPDTLAIKPAANASTQETFGRVLDMLARSGGELAERIVTTSPDVTVSTNLGSWVNRRRLFHHQAQADMFSTEKVGSFQRWEVSPSGQHIELGIAENNLFLLLAAAGLSHSLFGERLLPIGTLYDPFIERGLDALNYACYQDARFIVVATPSGISLAPEGGAHQSTATPLIGMAKDNLSAFEPAFADELVAMLRWSFEHLQREASSAPSTDLLEDAAGGSVYLRLSTRKLAQIDRLMDNALEQQVLAGGYWLHPPAAGSDLAIVYSGAVAPEAVQAHRRMLDEVPGAGLLAVTSADRLYRAWSAVDRLRRAGQGDAVAPVQSLLAPLAAGARLVTVLDGHPATLAWLGAVHGHRVSPLGVQRFGQSGALPDLYREHDIDADAIVAACQRRD